MSNPFNPLSWIRATQDWFTETERSSGFRPFLIFLLILFGFSLIVLWFFKGIPGIIEFIMYLIGFSVAVFLCLFIIKSFQDPDFCRSEKHIETVKQIELMQQKGQSSPIPIEAETASTLVVKPAQTMISSDQPGKDK